MGNGNRIFEIGPEFVASLMIDVSFALEHMDVAVGFSYNLSGISLAIPSHRDFKPRGNVKQGNTRAFKFLPCCDCLSPLSHAPSEHHIFRARHFPGPFIHQHQGPRSPTLQFGVTAFEGLQTTVLFVDINAAVGLKAGTLSTTQASPFCMEAYLEFYSTFGAQANFFKFFDLLLSSKIFDLTFPLYEVRHASPRSFLFLSC